MVRLVGSGGGGWGGSSVVVLQAKKDFKIVYAGRFVRFWTPFHMDQCYRNNVILPPVSQVMALPSQVTKFTVSSSNSDSVTASLDSSHSSQPTRVAAVSTRFQEGTELVKDRTSQLTSEQKKISSLRISTLYDSFEI